MCYTTAGLQLTRVSVINMSLQPVYENIVKPSHPIVDYNTRYYDGTVNWEIFVVEIFSYSKLCTKIKRMELKTHDINMHGKG